MDIPKREVPAGDRSAKQVKVEWGSKGWQRPAPGNVVGGPWAGWAQQAGGARGLPSAAKRQSPGRGAAGPPASPQQTSSPQWICRRASERPLS